MGNTQSECRRNLWGQLVAVRRSDPASNIRPFQSSSLPKRQDTTGGKKQAGDYQKPNTSNDQRQKKNKGKDERKGGKPKSSKGSGGGGGGGGEGGGGNDGPPPAAEHNNQNATNANANTIANDAGYTPEEDATLKRMKAEGKTWREIAAAMSRSQASLKKRFKDVGGGAAGAGNEQAKANNGEADAAENQQQGNKVKVGKDKKRPEKRAKNIKAAPRSPPKPDPKPTIKPPSPPAPPPPFKPSKATSVCPTTSTSSSGVRFTLREWQTLYEDDLFTLDELCCLAGIMRRERDWTWRRIASIFADRTGRYVHPEDIREKFERLWEISGEKK